MSAVAERRHVHTSGRAPASPPTPVPAHGLDATLLVSGRLLHRPRVAVEPCDKHGDVRPVVVLELFGTNHQRLKAHVPCPSHQAALSLAESLKCGHTVTLTCALSDIRHFLSAATFIATTTPE